MLYLFRDVEDVVPYKIRQMQNQDLAIRVVNVNHLTPNNPARSAQTADKVLRGVLEKGSNSQEFERQGAQGGLTERSFCAPCCWKVFGGVGDNL